MKFEVAIDDAGLRVLEQARQATQAADMPTFIQSLIDQSVADATHKFEPLTLPDAMKKIVDLSAEIARLTAELSAAQPQGVPLKVASP